MPSDNFGNQRRFPRIVLPREQGDLRQIIGLDAKVDEGTKVSVLDLSYSGAALDVSKNLSQSKVGEPLHLQFLYDGGFLKPIPSEIVRISSTAVGVKFRDLKPDTRLTFDEIMKDKMIGLNTYQIRTDILNPFERSRDLSCWYHGPKDTNIFIWQRHGQIEKAIIEFDYYLINFEGGQFHISRSQPTTELATDSYVAYVEKSAEASPVAETDEVILKRVLGMISQIPKKNAEINWLLDILVAKVKN